MVTIAAFGEPIYPTLSLLDSMENAPDSDLWYPLVEADNYYALQLLNTFTRERSIVSTSKLKRFCSHFGCLFGEILLETKLQMITTRRDKKASTRVGQFANGFAHQRLSEIIVQDGASAYYVWAALGGYPGNPVRMAGMIHDYVQEGEYDELVLQVRQFKLATQIFDAFGETVDNDSVHDLFTTSDSHIDRQFRSLLGYFFVRCCLYLAEAERRNI